MNKLLASFLLLTSMLAHAEPEMRSLTTVCGSREEMLNTLKNYHEEPIMASMNKEAGMMLWLFANMETGTSSWVAQVIKTNEWCMMGIGTEVILPPNSPLSTGTKIIFK